MDSQLSPISHRGGHHRVHESHLSLSEQESPIKLDKNPNDVIKFMMALLSLENTFLRIEKRQSDKKAAIQKIVIQDLKDGGGEFGQENFLNLAKDVKFYKEKTFELESELSKKRKQDQSFSAPLPAPARGKSPSLEKVHDQAGISKVTSERTRPYYDKKVYQVRNRSLIYHSIMQWIDFCRCESADARMTDMLTYFAFAKWKLKTSYKVNGVNKAPCS